MKKTNTFEKNYMLFGNRFGQRLECTGVRIRTAVVVDVQKQVALDPNAPTVATSTI